MTTVKRACGSGLLIYKIVKLLLKSGKRNCDRLQTAGSVDAARKSGVIYLQCDNAEFISAALARAASPTHVTHDTLQQEPLS